jgi:hypothetical protein
MIEVVCVQAYRWPGTAAEQSDSEGGWHTPEKREGRAIPYSSLAMSVSPAKLAL